MRKGRRSKKLGNEGGGGERKEKKSFLTRLIDEYDMMKFTFL